MNTLHPPTPEEIRRTPRELPPELISDTPLVLSRRLSNAAGSPVYIKDEGQQKVRSYKGRGSAAKMMALTDEERSRGVVCASAGNHAQGVAAACNYFHARGTVFMPTITPPQKIDATQRHGNGFVDIVLHGDKYDEAAQQAHAFAEESNAAFLHPFDDWDVIRGQGTVATEIADQVAALRQDLKAVLVPVGGGGLMAGTILALKDTHPDTQIIGVEPAGAACMTESLRAGHPVTLDRVDTFVDGAAVARPGEKPFSVISRAVQEGRARLMTVSNGLLAATMVDLYQIDGKITEPAGALSIAALEQLKRESEGTKVCILSGTNFDMNRNQSVLEYAKLHRRTKAYLGIHLPNRPQALRQMLNDLGGVLEAVNITYTHFDASQSNGDPSLILGLESKKGNPKDVDILLQTLSFLQNDEQNPRYPFHELSGKPDL
jgi:threonine dehydratase